jgi:hypothetical protein
MASRSFNRAVEHRRLTILPFQLFIRTDIGEFAAPGHIKELFDAAVKRKDGRPDARTKEGKQLIKFEREFCSEKLREWAAQ